MNQRLRDLFIRLKDRDCFKAANLYTSSLWAGEPDDKMEVYNLVVALDMHGTLLDIASDQWEPLLDYLESIIQALENDQEFYPYAVDIRKGVVGARENRPADVAGDEKFN